ncbi:hypothetical protein [Runella sp.]|uniref:hypothetical protein n=1 Tax=Runella sp. TaxID=1960881 RepID=UPI003D118C0C
MRWCIFFIIIGIAVSNCNRRFNSNMLNDAKGNVVKKSIFKFYDDPDTSFYYLLTFYRTNEKIIGEDFSFESVNTFKKNQSVDPSKIVQNVALYFFSNGGVIYDTPYIVHKSKENLIGEYQPINLRNFQDLYKTKQELSKVNKKIEKLRKRLKSKPNIEDEINLEKFKNFATSIKEYIELSASSKLANEDYRGIMHGYQLKDLNPGQIVEDTPPLTNNTKDSTAKRVQQNHLSNYNNATLPKDSSISMNNGDLIKNNNKKNAQIKPTLHIYLERRNKNYPLILNVNHIPKTGNNVEAILIESIFFQKEINSSSGKYTFAAIDNTFNLGNISDNLANGNQPDSTKSLLWFKLMTTFPKNKELKK